MRDRSTIHHTKIEDFTAFLVANGFVIEEPKGCEVLRARLKSFPPIIYFKRDRADHLTSYGVGLTWQKHYMRNRRATK